MAVMVGGIELSAQAPPTKQLVTPIATFPESWTRVTSMRELADGRVLVSDGRDNTLQVVDFTSGEMKPVGRVGSGPAEWRNAARLYPMPGDSTLMPDFGNERYFVILPDGTPGPTFRIPDQVGSLLGVDAQGHLIIERERYEGTGPAARSAGVVDIRSFNRATGAVEPLGTRNEVRGETSGASQRGNLLHFWTNLPLAPRDIAVVPTMGRVAIVRAQPYHVERISVTGAREVGPPASASNIRVTQDERDAFLRSQVRPGQIMVRGNAGAAPAPRERPQVSAADLRALTNPDMTWPDVKPPFLAGAALSAPNDRVWVLRTRPHNDSIPTYDVFAPDGRVEMRVAISARSRVVGFGRGVVYVVRIDEDDLEHLERHALP